MLAVGAAGIDCFRWLLSKTSFSAIIDVTMAGL
jgi:hypothetical protein